jgi:hypothetical protein
LDNYGGSGAYDLVTNTDQLALSGRGADIFGTTNEFVAVTRNDMPGDFDISVNTVKTVGIGVW